MVAGREGGLGICGVRDGGVPKGLAGGWKGLAVLGGGKGLDAVTKGPKGMIARAGVGRGGSCSRRRRLDMPFAALVAGRRAWTDIDWLGLRRPTGRARFSCCGHRGMQSRKVAHHLFVFVLLVCVHCLRVLTEIVQARELLPAMASKGPLPSVFSTPQYVSRRLQCILQRTYRICRARCSLRLKTILHSP